MSPTVVGYACQRDGLPSVTDQGKAIRAWADELNLAMGDIYEDERVKVHIGDGRRRDTERPTMRRLSLQGAADLLDLAVQESLVVIVTDLEVLERDDLPELAHLPGVVLVAGEDRLPEIKPPPPTPRTPMGVAERLFRGREANAAKGRHQSGPCPYGYVRDEKKALIHDPVEVEIVRTIFRQYLRSKSMKRLVGFLNNQGLRTRRARLWSRAGVAWILKNETYLGKVHFGQVRAKGLHRPIITPIVFNQVQKLIRQNNKKSGKKFIDGNPASV